MASDPIPVSATARAYWRRTRQLTAWLLGVWLAATIAVVFFARQLSHVTLFGWPLSFYLAAQGILLIYLAIVALYAWRMRRFDRMYHAEERHVP